MNGTAAYRSTQLFAVLVTLSVQRLAVLYISVKLVVHTVGDDRYLLICVLVSKNDLETSKSLGRFSPSQLTGVLWLTVRLMQHKF